MEVLFQALEQYMLNEKTVCHSYFNFVNDNILTFRVGLTLQNPPHDYARGRIMRDRQLSSEIVSHLGHYWVKTGSSEKHRA